MCPGASVDSNDFNDSNIVLTGFMGTGKSAVGERVARQLGRRLVDMDAEIEARAGKSIPRIFAEEGEASFRKLEATLCRELSRERGLVVATGGGALVDPDSRRCMMASGTVICLTASPARILERVARSGGPERPLLDVPDPRAEVERLLEARRAAYAAIPWQLDTGQLSVEQVAERVVALAQVITLRVHHPGPGGEYPVYVGDGLLAHAGGALRAAGAPEAERVAVVTNSTVGPLYAAQVIAALRAAGLAAFECVIPDGEGHKRLDTVAMLYDRFLAGELGRGGTVLALGGGVTGDIAGFAAASFMRGVRFAQVPTTLLAMVDASVGGKTGVDLPQGKNLVGAFKQPAMVLIDPGVLDTLPVEELRSGMAELIKHGVIGAPELFEQLEEMGGGARLKIEAGQIAQALAVKVEIVEEDPFEGGRRAVLNLGHTLGHALEKLSGFSLRHGEAVSIGTVAAARIAAALDRAGPDLALRVAALLEDWGLPVACPPYPVDAIWEGMAHDKKRRGGALRWILPEDIGRVAIVEDVPPQVVKRVLQEMGALPDE
jgi:shikimate kinase/3-dehydroquinate synthase